MNIIKKIGDYGSLVKFSHTIFAMPFALIAFVYALYENPHISFEWQLLIQIVLCMVFARNVAMAFNRWADRNIDKENPRTADREIPKGVITPNNALWFIAINAILFIAVTATINWLTLALSPIALFVITAYSYCKRFTPFAHLVLGLSLGIAPAGAYIATTSTLTLPPMLLSLLVITWCGGFDIIYALQDADFDRQRGLHSIPSHFSVATSLYISIALHAVSATALVLFALYCPQSIVLWCGVAIFCAILIAEHILVTPKQQRNIGIAFGTLNGLASTTLAAFMIANFLLFG